MRRGPKVAGLIGSRGLARSSTRGRKITSTAGCAWVVLMIEIVAEGLQHGTRRHRSVALGAAAQFELTLRPSDVIGEWVDGTIPLQAGAIVDRGQI
jgi:hypothetical protein